MNKSIRFDGTNTMLMSCKSPSVEVFVPSVVYNVSCSHLGLCNVNSVNVDYMIVFISGALLDSIRLIRKVNPDGLSITYKFKYSIKTITPENQSWR